MSDYEELDLRIKFAQLQVQMGLLIIQTASCGADHREFMGELQKGLTAIQKLGAERGIDLD